MSEPGLLGQPQLSEGHSPQQRSFKYEISASPSQCVTRSSLRIHLLLDIMQYALSRDALHSFGLQALNHATRVNP